MKMMPKSKGRCQDADLRGEDGSLKNLQWRWQAGSARLVLFEEFVWSLQIWNTGNAELRIFDCNATMELKPWHGDDDGCGILIQFHWTKVHEINVSVTWK